MSPKPASNAAIYAATGAAAAMIAFHVGGKAVRDALFLSSFSIKALPVMVIVASLFSIVAVLATSRAMTRFTPARLVPAAFGVSSALLAVVWAVQSQAPKAAAVVIYLQIVGLGSLLTSGFWSMVNERFDPRSAKKQIGRIAGAGTLGGMLGGVLAERVAAYSQATTMLPILAGLHLACAFLLHWLKPLEEAPEDRRAGKEEAEKPPSVFSVMKGAPYLRTLAGLVLMGTISAAMIDFVFKSQAVSHYGRGENLLRFFAIFYSATGVLTFLLQAALSGISLQRLGLAKTVGSLPMSVSLGAAGALVLPGLPAATVARALEAVFRGSLFRGGYELFYTPIPAREKRAAKSIVDVGFDRLGDAVGNGIVGVMLRFGPSVANQAILGGAIVVALAGLAIASRLHRAYIGALEKGLMDRADELDQQQSSGGGPNDTMMMTGAMTGFGQSMSMSLSMIMPKMGLPGSPPESSTRHPAAPAGPQSSSSAISSSPSVAPVSSASSSSSSWPASRSDTGIVKQPAAAAPVPALSDPLLQHIAELRSGDQKKVLRMLQSPEPLSAALVPHVVNLLVWDQVYAEAIRALRKVADLHTGQLCDLLLDPKSDFAIRRRLPRVISSGTSQRAADGLLLALKDRRFEVRFQCGRALTMLVQKSAHIKVPSEAVYEAVNQEVNVGRPVWESHRLMDRQEDKESSPIVDEFLRERTNRSLEHVFTLLGLALPMEPLKIAFRGLHTDDQHLRGTALEYLESTLPPKIRERMWPFLDHQAPAKRPERPAAAPERPKEQLLNDLLASNQSIMINLAELRKKAEGGSKS